VPSLDLRFADTKSLVDAVTGASLVTFTRASDGTYVDSAGVIQTAAVDVPRFDHNPTTGESLGLLVEEQRTNSIRNNTMVGTVAGTPGTVPTNWAAIAQAEGLTREIIGTGASNGITYIDIKYSGTTTDGTSVNLAFDGNAAIAALTGQSWTSSAYVTVVGGSLANITNALIRAVERTAVGSFVGSTDVSFASANGALSLNRFSVTRTLGATAGAVQGAIFLGMASGVAIDITLRIGLPQLEHGAFATSVIPTTTAAVTRSADVASITGSAFSSWYRQDEGTVFVEFNDSNSSGSRYPYAFSDNTTNNRFASFRTGATLLAHRIVAAGIQANPGSQTVSLVASIKSALAAKVGTDGSIAALNGALSTSASPTLMPTVDRMYIGAGQSGGEQLCGTIRRLTFWPTRFPNATLQAITQ
jgi:hypothetical protein